MPSSLSISNILQALYEESTTIKTYVDCIASGQPAPFTLITKTSDHEKNEQIVKRLREEYDATKNLVYEGDPFTMTRVEYLDILANLLNIFDEEFILEEDESYTVIMFKGDAIVEGSRQIVKGEKIEQLKDYARYKGYEISVKKVKDK